MGKTSRGDDVLIQLLFYFIFVFFFFYRHFRIPKMNVRANVVQ